MNKPTVLSVLLVLIVLLLASPAYAACTFSEAQMAFERGNSHRGLALMSMAARDGDERAVRYLANLTDDYGLQTQFDHPTLNLVVVKNAISVQE